MRVILTALSMFLRALAIGALVFGTASTVFYLKTGYLILGIDSDNFIGALLAIAICTLTLSFIPGAVTAILASFMLLSRQRPKKFLFSLICAGLAGLSYCAFLVLANLRGAMRFAGISQNNIFAFNTFEIVVVGTAILSFGLAGLLVGKIRQKCSG